MGDTSDVSILRMLQRQMAIVSVKAQTAASNLANLDTPDFKTREVVFANVLEEQLAQSPSMHVTHSAHLGSAGPNVSVREAEGLAQRRDGNNVQLDRELMAISGAPGEFKRVATAFEAKIRMLRYAVNEGR